MQERWSRGRSEGEETRKRREKERGRKRKGHTEKGED